MIVIGVDPGMYGAIALYASGRLVEVCDMPLSGNAVDPYQLARIFETLCAAEGCDMVVVEEQEAPPSQSSSTTKKVGRNQGVIEGVVAALGYRITMVRSSVWKRRLGIPAAPSDLTPSRKTSWKKEAARKRASEVMPEGVNAWPLKKDADRAEAGLLAYYGAHYELARAPTKLPQGNGPIAAAGDLFAGEAWPDPPFPEAP